MENKKVTTRAVREFLRDHPVGGDWDDEEAITARFKAFSGQRSDWEPRYLFWRDLILQVALHFRIFLIRPSQVKEWFTQGGLTPLCLDRVFIEMYNAGDLVPYRDLVGSTCGDPTQLFLIFSKVVSLLGRTFKAPHNDILQDDLVLLAPLKARAEELVMILSESHWTSSCIITIRKFQDICEGPSKASAILSYLSGRGKAQHISVNKNEVIEGVKLSLSTATTCCITSLDYDILHLIWTTERLQQRLDLIDQHFQVSRETALTYLRSGDRKAALRHVKELKLASESREKCMSLLNRVDEVLSIIADAESTKKVSEAIQLSTRAIKENQISMDEVQLCLEELDESLNSQQQIEIALGTSEDEDMEEEFKKLKFEVGSDNLEVQIPEAVVDGAVREAVCSDSVESLSNALSSFKLSNDAARDSENMDYVASTRDGSTKNLTLEAA
ncbi:Snf7 family [Dillenia turbinata]|uniref:Snf7 family n=1 Tax=Dillenia turbinata TaxID=194707 RepID=A0AAN8W433_9MAGN